MGTVKQIIQDTRDQIGKHKNIEQYMALRGVEIIRNKMLVGDYTLPNNSKVCIDVKKDILEIAGNICSPDHERFRRECLLAQRTHKILFVLIQENKCAHGEISCPEDVTYWESPKYKYGAHKGEPMTRVKGAVLAKAMRTMEKEYGVVFLFCDPQETGRIILALLGDRKND